jgi:hypothetical protein
MLEEAREDHKENDAANLRRKCKRLHKVNEIMGVLANQLIEMGSLAIIVQYIGVDGARREAF